MLKFFKSNWILLLALFLLVIMSWPLIYFGSLLKMLNQTEGASTAVYSDNLAVGVCFNNLMAARWMKEKDAMFNEARRQGITIRFEVAHNSLARQIEQITNLVARHVKVLIINPVRRTGLEEVLGEANRKGVKIIEYDELTTGPADLFLGVDYREIGRIQAASLLEKAGPGNYLVFKGTPGSYRGEALYSGQQEILASKAGSARNFITTDILPTWSADEAVNKTRALITRQKLHGILAPDDLIAEEVIKFFKEQKTTAPLITGAGAEVTACQRILRDEQLMSVYFDYQTMAKTAIISARRFCPGSPAAPEGSLKLQTVSINGKRLPAYIFPVYQVTKNNLYNLLIDKLKVYTNQDLEVIR